MSQCHPAAGWEDWFESNFPWPPTSWPPVEGVSDWWDGQKRYWGDQGGWADWMLPDPGKGDPFADHYYQGGGAPFDLQGQSPTTFQKFKGQFGHLDDDVHGDAQDAAADKARELTCQNPAYTIRKEYNYRYDYRFRFDSDLMYFGRGRVKVVVLTYVELKCCNGKPIGYTEHTQIYHTIDDRFEDVADFNSDIPGNQELPGGIGYPIGGGWTTPPIPEPIFRPY